MLRNFMFLLTMEEHKGIASLALEMQKMKDVMAPVSAVLEMQKMVEATRLPKSALEFFMDSYFLKEQTGILKLNSLRNELAHNRLPDLWLSKENSFWQEQRKWREERDFLKNHFASRELLKGVTLSTLGRSALDMSAHRAFNESFLPSLLSGGLADTVRKNEAMLSMFKTSRIVSDLSKNTRDFYKVEYDFSKVTESGEEEEKIIKPSLLITEARNIKKVIFDIYRNNANLFKIKPRQFEELVAELLLKKGYQVELTKQTRDGGYDIIALSFDNGMPLKYLVECKKFGKRRSVGIDIIRSFCDVINTENANKGIIFTTSYFTSVVRERQKSIPYILELKDHADVIQWVQNYVVSF